MVRGAKDYRDGPKLPLKLKPNAAMQLPQSGRPPLKPSRIGSGQLYWVPLSLTSDFCPQHRFLLTKTGPYRNFRFAGRSMGNRAFKKSDDRNTYTETAVSAGFLLDMRLTVTASCDGADPYPRSAVRP